MTGPGAGWGYRRVEVARGFNTREVFTSPEGVDYIRTPTAELAEITITNWKRKGLAPLYLKRLSETTAHMRKDEAA